MNLEQLEKYREEKLSKCRRNNIIYIVLIIIGILVMIGVFKTILPFFIFILFILRLPFSIINGKHASEYKNKFMNSLLPVAVNSILTDVHFDGNSGISRALVASTHSMSTGDIYSSSNYVAGKYKDINVQMSDVHIQTESTDSEGHTTYYTIFRGQWLIFDFNKQFKSNIQVWEKSVFGGISRNWNKSLKKIELEDIDFNKKFKVLSENDLEAFYILTPKLMERIKQVEASIKGTLMMVFLNNQLHVAVYNNRTTFNVNIRKKIDFDKFSKEALSDLDAIIKFVDILELDNSLFKVSYESSETVPIINQQETTTTAPVEQEVVASEPVNNGDSNNDGIPDDANVVDYFNNINNNGNKI